MQSFLDSEAWIKTKNLNKSTFISSKGKYDI